MENQNKDQLVQVPKSQLDAIMAQLSALKQAIGTPEVQKATATKEHTIVVRYVDDKPVVGFANIGHPDTPVYTYEKPNPLEPTKKIMFAKILTLNEDDELDTPIELPYGDFINQSRRVVCKIIKIDKKPWSESQGEVDKVKVDWDKFKTQDTGETVQALVNGFHMTYTVEDPSGRVYTLQEQTINI